MEAALAEDRDPEAIIAERGWELITDPAKIAQAVEEVRIAEAAVFEEARTAGAKRAQTLRAFLVGKVLEKTGGRADPRIAGDQINALIGG